MNIVARRKRTLRGLPPLTARPNFAVLSGSRGNQCQIHLFGCSWWQVVPNVHHTHAQTWNALLTFCRSAEYGSISGTSTMTPFPSLNQPAMILTKAHPRLYVV